MVCKLFLLVAYFDITKKKQNCFTVNKDIDGHCMDDYLDCGSKYCIHRDLVCERIIHCYPSSLICDDKSK